MPPEIAPEVRNYLIDLWDGFADDRRFAAESLSVQNEQGILTPMVWRTAQEKLGAAIRKQQDAGKPVRIIILKKRRGGFSTGVAAKFFKHTAFYPGQATLIVAHEKAAAANLFGMYDRFAVTYKPFGENTELGLPGIAMPATTSRMGGESGKLEFDNRSSISIATANNLQSTRSFGYRRVHLSEFAFYRDAKTLMTALMQTVPLDPDTMVIIESTANGVGGEFYDQWMLATDPNRESDWVPLFFAWHEDETCQLEIQGGRGIFQNSLSDEELRLQEQYHLNLEQLNWRRWCIANMCGGDVRVFQQEYPGNAAEAFLTSGRPRFDPLYIDRYRPQDGTVGELELEEYNGEKRLLFTSRDRGGLQLYRRPEKGRNYIIGADTALGLDATEGQATPDTDFCVAQIFDQDTGEQVGVYRARVTEAYFSKILWRLGAWYNWAYVVPEVQQGFGRSTLDGLIEQQYPLERIYVRRNESVSSKPRYEDLGWNTNTVTRPQLLGALDRALTEGSIIIYDPITLQELRTFVIGPTGKAEAQRGCHDDTVIALGLVVIGIQRGPRLQLIHGGGHNTPQTGDAPSFYSRSVRRRVQ